MRAGHRATAAPVGLALAWSLAATEGAPLAVSVLCGGLVVATSTLNDWDHPRFKGSYHPGAALVRASGHLGYMIRTPQDQDRDDVHRGPSHCVEWCVLLGALVAAFASSVPLLGVHLYAAWWGLAVTVGTVSHIAADAVTPSGVPICATWNYLRHREVWKRHSLGWFSTDSGGERAWVLLVCPGVTVLGVLIASGNFLPLLSALTGVTF